MPKKPTARPDAPPPLPSRDHFERTHFAVQASVYLQQLAPGLASTEPAAESTATEAGEASRKRNRRAGGQPYGALARSMGNVKGWTEHNQVKIDPSLKRTLCSKCSTVLIPGLTSRVRIRPCKVHCNVIHTLCLTCNHTLSIPARPNEICDVDGPKRAAKRQRRLRSVVFHEREGGTGHVLWHGNEKVHGWGVPMPEPDCSPADAQHAQNGDPARRIDGQKAQNGQKGGKSQKGQKGQNQTAQLDKHSVSATQSPFDEEEAFNM